MTKTPASKLMATRPLTTEAAAERAIEAPDDGAQRISLLIYRREGPAVVSLGEGQSLVVGRDPTADYEIDDPSLSRRHARFDLIEGDVWVEDLGSTNRTKLNGVQVQRERVTDGDEVLMGSVGASIHVLAPTRHRGQNALLTHDRFVGGLEAEVARARCFSRPFALLMLQADDTKLARHARAVRARLRPVDTLGRFSPMCFEVLLPEVGADDVHARATALIGAMVGVPMRCGVAVFPESGTNAEDLIQAGRAAARRATLAKPVVFASAQEHTEWQREADTPGDDASGAGPVIQSAGMVKLYGTVDRLAESVIPVLLLGETGTGKEVLARAIHERGPRVDAPMRCINCGAIPATLVESVLFGHERGAFTGATQQSKGMFEQADGGTVLLDEVGELSPSAQAALLRVLETKHITRVGSGKETKVDVRIIAATHRDLEAMCEAGTFRWDLVYRLNAMTLKIPPLRERPEEIAPLVMRFVRQANALNGRDVAGLTPDALGLLLRYAWPGNVRELRNAIDRAVVITEGDRVTIEDLPERIAAIADEAPLAPAVDPLPVDDAPRESHATVDQPAARRDGPADFKAEMSRFEAQLILEALEAAGGNRTEAARQLQMPVRTLSHKIRQHGIKRRGFGKEA